LSLLKKSIVTIEIAARFFESLAMTPKTLFWSLRGACPLVAGDEAISSLATGPKAGIHNTRHNSGFLFSQE